jgi:acyl-CoA thioesterase-1
VSRLPQALAEHRPEVVIIQLGGNDGLRGLGPEQTYRHLLQMVRMVRAARARVLLLGVQLPANYGNEFRNKFHQVYHNLAEQEAVPLVPFFLDGVAQDLALMQADGIHPGAAAQAKILDNIWPALAGILSQGP